MVGAVTPMPLSNYAGPLFVQSKHLVKLHPLAEFRKSNAFGAKVYINNNHRDGTVLDEQHMTGNKICQN